MHLFFLLGCLWLRCPRCCTIPASERGWAFLCWGSGSEPGRIGSCHQHSQGLCWDDSARYNTFDHSQSEDCAGCLDLCWLLCFFDSACVLSWWKRKSGTSGHRWNSVFFTRVPEERFWHLMVWKNRMWFTNNWLVFLPQSPVLCSLCQMTYSSITSRSLEPY